MTSSALSAFQSMLEDIAERLVLADLTDGQALLELQECFHQAGALAAMAGLEVAREPVARALKDLDRRRAEGTGSSSNDDLADCLAILVRASSGEDSHLSDDDNVARAEFLTRHQAFADESAEQMFAAAAGSAEALAAFKRSLHTLKGDAGMLGLDDLGRVCHGIEEAVARAERLPVAAVQKALDWIASTLDKLGGNSTELAPVAAVETWLRVAADGEAGVDQYLAHSLQVAGPGATGLEPDQRLILGGPLPDAATADLVSEFLSEAHEQVVRSERWLQGYHPRTTDPEALHGLFRAFHTIKGMARFMHLVREQTLAQAGEDLLDRVRIGGRPCDRDTIHLLLKALNALKGLLSGLAMARAGSPRPDTPDLPDLVALLRGTAAGATAPSSTRQGRAPALGDILVGTGTVSRVAVAAALAAQQQLGSDQRLGEILIEAGHLSTGELRGALAQQEDGAGKHGPTIMATTMRVEVGRVEVLNEAIGELVIAQNMLRCSPELRGIGNRRLQTLLAQLDRVTRNIQGMAMQLRMVAVKPVFQRMVRLGHDAARKLGKDIEVVLEGEDQEIDKSLVDRLGDPLVHLVRNACDHGIEVDPAVRRAAGKPAQGQVLIRAYRSAGNFCVSVGDDGRGLARDRILAKAIERGLVRDGHNLADRDIFELIFLPGFSTAEQVTDVSGRGVGMDVVKRMVDEMHGTVELTSAPGRGSTVTIQLPLTLAVIDGMIVAVGKEQYVIPTLSVVAAVHPHPEQIQTICGQARMLNFQDQHIPLIGLGGLFATPGSRTQRSIAVVVDGHGQRIALEVDALLGRQQVVLKPMAGGIPAVPGLSGSTINGDGRVCLVIDVPGLIHLATAAPSGVANSGVRQATQNGATHAHLDR